MSDLFSTKYPYTDFHELNLDWVIDQIKKLDQDLSSLEERVKEAAIAASKEYIDAEMSEIRTQMATLQANFTALLADVEDFKDETLTYMEARLTFLANEIDLLDSKIDASVIGVNARTDLAIEQNNDYLLNQITDKLLPGMKVVNMFTGEKMSVQAMFNYLGSLHTEDGATVNYVVSADKTVRDIIAINASCTDWVLHGRTLLA